MDLNKNKELFKISWINSKGKMLEITHLNDSDIAKFSEGFKSENKEFIVCPMP
jgi:hypothetical protein